MCYSVHMLMTFATFLHDVPWRLLAVPVIGGVVYWHYAYGPGSKSED